MLKKVLKKFYGVCKTRLHLFVWSSVFLRAKPILAEGTKSSEGKEIGCCFLFDKLDRFINTNLKLSVKGRDLTEGG